MEDNHHPLYTASFIGAILLFNVVVTIITWFCFNLIDNFSINFTDAVMFVVIFRIVEWAKQTILEMCFS